MKEYRKGQLDKKRESLAKKARTIVEACKDALPERLHIFLKNIKHILMKKSKS